MLARIPEPELKSPCLYLYDIKRQGIMKKVLIVSGHPDLDGSFANRTILEETGRLLPEAGFVRLDKLYPDFRIDVKS